VRTLSARVYRLLLGAYPRAFRADVGAEMEAMFHERYEAERRRGRLACAVLWARTAWDTAGNAVPERVGAIRAWLEQRLDPPPDAAAPSQKGSVMDTLVQDLRYALRSLAARPGFTAVAVLTIALGIGANAAIFSVVNAVLIAPLPFPAADRLVIAWATNKTGGRLAASWPEFVDWRAQARSFEQMGVWRSQSVNLTGTAAPDRLIGSFVTASFLDLIGARASLGRTLRPDETEPATAKPVALLSHDAWTRRFGADPGIVGRSLVLNGKIRTVVGVVGPELGAGRVPFDAWFLATEVWLPVADFPNGLERGQSEMIVVARLREGATRAAAQADLGVVARRLEQTYPDTHAGRGVAVVALHDEIAGDARAPLFVLLGAVAFVLLIACGNVANLLIARAAQRQREMAMRAALGAGRGRLIRQLLTESVVLAAAGAVVGLGLAFALLRGLLAIVPPAIGLPGRIAVDPTVLLFTGLVALATAFLFGLVPALQASRPDLEVALREAGRSGAGSRARRRLRDTLVVAEVALSLVLLVGAGLLLRTMHTLAHADPGFRPERLLTMEFRLPPSKYERPEQIAAFFRAILDRMRAVPGVESVALARAVPFSGNSGGSPYAVEGRDAPAGVEPVAQTNIVSPGYFRLMGVPILRGREFAETDSAQTSPVAVVSETFARQAWPGEEAIGRLFRYKGQDRWLTVVGVVADMRHGSFTELPRAQAYTPHEQDPKIFACVLARTSGEPLALARPIREAIWSVDPDQPVWKVRTMESLLETARGPARALGSLLGAFAAVAIFLAGVGLYGVLSGIVAQRTREIGIRVALGAPTTRVVALVVGRGMALTGLAIGVGLAGAAGLSRLMSSVLFGVRPLDPLTFAGAAAMLALVALAACYVPARRAARVDPVVALAEE
jgi:putative ABC transport system permease protein